MGSKATDPPADGPISVDMRPKSAHRRGSADSDAPIAELAASQHGVVELGQLRALGFPERAVTRRVAAGRLHRVHQGVFAVGHPRLSAEGRWMAAVLACGPEAVLSHRSAATLWGMRDAERAPVDVTASGRRGRAPVGVRAHRHDSLRDRDRTTSRGIPCTGPARTLLDLAGTLHHAELRKAVAEAEVLGLVDREALDQLVKRSRGRRGVARLRQLVSSLDPQTARTRTELERRFLKLCHQAGLTSPEVNSRLDLGRERIEPDFLWRDARLIVETDGRRFHDTATAFERDRRRDQLLAAAGWRVVRFTWGQVTREPSRVARTVEALLTQATRRPAGRNRSDSDRNRPVGG